MEKQRMDSGESFVTLREVKEAYLPSLSRSEKDRSEESVRLTRERTEQAVRRHLSGLRTASSS
jgi:hypothetical protein